MTVLRIDMKKFKELCEEVRYRWEARTAEDRARDERMGNTVVDAYRVARIDADLAVRSAPLWMQPVEPKAADAAALRSQLQVAAQACQQYGATTAQIDYIVDLAVRNDDFNVLSGGRLSKVEASRIIEFMGNRAH